MNYVNEAKFIAWYTAVAKEPHLSSASLLADVFQQYVSTHTSEYIIPAEKAISGREERYPFHFENIGACGASTFFIHF